MHLLDLLEAEAQGLPVILQKSCDRDNAIATRLANFQNLSTATVPAIDPLRPAATGGGGITLSLQEEDEQARAEVIKLARRLLILDDINLDKRRLRTG